MWPKHWTRIDGYLIFNARSCNHGGYARATLDSGSGACGFSPHPTPLGRRVVGSVASPSEETKMEAACATGVYTLEILRQRKTLLATKNVILAKQWKNAIHIGDYF